MSKRRYDEDDVRIRASRSTRPRSKDRPSHEDATQAIVTTIDRGRITCRTESGQPVLAIRARELGRKSVAVGDRVALVGDISGSEGSLARLVRIEERQSVLRRSADDEDTVERVLVANAEQLVIVTSTASPEPSFGLIDRCLVAAYDAGIAPLLMITKTDLAPADDIITTYSSLGIPYLTTTKTSSLDEVHEILANRRSVFVGHSGVGKSTLVNRLVPDAERATGHVNAVTGRGRHTSSSAVAFALPYGGWVIDTPGVRSFGLAHIDVNRVVHAFADLGSVIEKCPRNCSHDEDECALNNWAAESESQQVRIDGLRRLLRSRRLAE
jgi:ribosome biogenesis GTPase / thiamine phosphate phosphatase